MRKSGIIGALLIIFIFGFSWMVSGKEAVDDISVPMGSFLLEPPESVTAKRPPVDFPHSRHFDYSCKTCHHTWDYESEIQTCTTAACHNATEPAKKPEKLSGAPKTDDRYFKNAFHTSCMDCHKKIKKENAAEEKKLQEDADSGAN